MSGLIKNGSDNSIQYQTGTVPDVSGAMQDYFQNITMSQIVKSVVGFQAVETLTTWSFFGVIQPFTPRQLMLKPEGQRAWTWITLHAEPSVTLQVDDIMIWNGIQTRVMSRQDFTLYGYLLYELCQDWVAT